MDVMLKEKKTFHLQIFSGVAHGFALRGDPDIPYERKYHSCSRYPID